MCELTPNKLFYFHPSSLQRVSRGRSMVPYCTCVGESRYHTIPYFWAEKKVVWKAILWHRGINTKMDSTVMWYDQQQKVGARTKKKENVGPGRIRVVLQRAGVDIVRIKGFLAIFKCASACALLAHFRSFVTYALPKGTRRMQIRCFTPYLRPSISALESYTFISVLSHSRDQNQVTVERWGVWLSKKKSLFFSACVIGTSSEPSGQVRDCSPIPCPPPRSRRQKKWRFFFWEPDSSTLNGHLVLVMRMG